MRRTAQSIEENKEARRAEKPRKKGGKKPQRRQSEGKKTGFRGPSPDVGKATQWKPGQSGNPGGLPKDDVSRAIARAAFENDPAALIKAFQGALRRGNAYTFKELADRAYGKVKDRVEHSGAMRFEGLSSAELDARLEELLKKYQREKKA
jgi:hypothetical protein